MINASATWARGDRPARNTSVLEELVDDGPDDLVVGLPREPCRDRPLGDLLVVRVEGSRAADIEDRARIRRRRRFEPVPVPAAADEPGHERGRPFGGLAALEDEAEPGE